MHGYNADMNKRQISPIDQLLSGVDNALRTITVKSAGPARANPAGQIADADLSPAERRHAAGLMRVNHAGEVAAQALYQGHAAVARDPAVATHMRQAADEERDHLHWCEERIGELDASVSRLSPLWYAGAFAIGAASGVLGDRWSLGFVAETERQVAEHLGNHLEQLPAADLRSRAIVQQMRDEEIEHGAEAKQRGAADLPPPVRRMMQMTAKIMKRTAYRL
ncbi:MAG: 2-polyprenyl-3-methyl-6-methoxy-1,4-benzoquinone monooxygenase [Woeseia sp.]